MTDNLTHTPNLSTPIHSFLTSYVQAMYEVPGYANKHKPNLEKLRGRDFETNNHNTLC